MVPGEKVGEILWYAICLVIQCFKIISFYSLTWSTETHVGGDLGKLHVVNDLVDGLLYVGWMIHLLNYLEVQTGIAVKV